MSPLHWVISVVFFVVYTWAVHTRAKDKGHEEVFYHLDKALMEEQKKARVDKINCKCTCFDKEA